MTNGDEATSMDIVTDVTTAEREAVAAARIADVRVRDLSTLEDFAAVCRLFHDIWQPDPENPLATVELLRALTKAGNYLGGAFDENRLVGACMGFFGAPADGTMHSHIAGVATGAGGRSIGYAIKLHQRAWALRRGVGAIAWTFDPLVARNAYFNLTKLGATATEYLPNFYGDMRDVVNGDDETDRLLVRWDLRNRAVPTATPGDAVVALGRTPDGAPEEGRTAADTLLVAVPSDIEKLRFAEPSLGKAWRVAMRDVLGGLLADGARITAFDRAGWFVVSRESQ